MTKVCEYYFAPQSPYAYLGHARFMHMMQKPGVALEIKPIDLGRVFSVSGGLPLAKRPPQRQAYRLLELKRWSDFLQVPLNPQPAFFPVAGDLAAKLIIATQVAHGNDAAFAVTHAIMRALWAEEKNIADPDQLTVIAVACGLDGKQLMQAAGDTAIETAYDHFTQQAIDLGVFGVPWYVVDGESFWGQDRLDFVERALAR